MNSQLKMKAAKPYKLRIPILGLKGAGKSTVAKTLLRLTPSLGSDDIIGMEAVHRYRLGTQAVEKEHRDKQALGERTIPVPADKFNHLGDVRDDLDVYLEDHPGLDSNEDVQKDVEANWINFDGCMAVLDATKEPDDPKVWKLLTLVNGLWTTKRQIPVIVILNKVDTPTDHYTKAKTIKFEKVVRDFLKAAKDVKFVPVASLRAHMLWATQNVKTPDEFYAAGFPKGLIDKVGPDYCKPKDDWEEIKTDEERCHVVYEHFHRLGDQRFNKAIQATNFGKLDTVLREVAFGEGQTKLLANQVQFRYAQLWKQEAGGGVGRQQRSFIAKVDGLHQQLEGLGIPVDSPPEGFYTGHNHLTQSMINQIKGPLDAYHLKCPLERLSVGLLFGKGEGRKAVKEKIAGMAKDLVSKFVGLVVEESSKQTRKLIPTQTNQTGSEKDITFANMTLVEWHVVLGCLYTCVAPRKDFVWESAALLRRYSSVDRALMKSCNTAEVNEAMAMTTNLVPMYPETYEKYCRIPSDKLAGPNGFESFISEIQDFTEKCRREEMVADAQVEKADSGRQEGQADRIADAKEGHKKPEGALGKQQSVLVETPHTYANTQVAHKKPESDPSVEKRALGHQQSVLVETPQANTQEEFFTPPTSLKNGMETERASDRAKARPSDGPEEEMQDSTTRPTKEDNKSNVVADRASHDHTSGKSGGSLVADKRCSSPSSANCTPTKKKPKLSVVTADDEAAGKAKEVAAGKARGGVSHASRKNKESDVGKQPHSVSHRPVAVVTPAKAGLRSRNASSETGNNSPCVTNANMLGPSNPRQLDYQRFYDSIEQSEHKVFAITTPKSYYGNATKQLHIVRVDWDQMQKDAASVEAAKTRGMYPVLFYVRHYMDCERKAVSKCRFWPNVREMQAGDVYGPIYPIKPTSYGVKAFERQLERVGNKKKKKSRRKPLRLYKDTINLWHECIVGPFNFCSEGNEGHHIGEDVWEQIRKNEASFGGFIDDIAPLQSYASMCQKKRQR